MSDAQDPTQPPSVTVSFPRVFDAKTPRSWLYFVLVAGVAGPLVAITAEKAYRVCSLVCNPIPTWWHLTLLCVVPSANLFALWAYFGGGARRRTAAALLVGIAVGVSFVYSLNFLPLVPFSIIGILCFGLGLLGLTPFFALAASIVAARRLGSCGQGRSVPRLAFRAGVAAAVLVLSLYSFSQAMTLVGMRMAASDDVTVRLRGVRLIRALGSETALLRACYALPMDIWLGLATSNTGENRVTTQEAREIYFRVTGKPFNSVPPPQARGWAFIPANEFEFDPDLGGDIVGGVSQGVSLRSSRIDTVVEPDALVAYTEWTMVFGNSSSTQREARAEIALPPGGVVSRLTLWVDGEEREAVFSTRGKARAAYQEVAVVQRRDPVLVTTCGPDRLLMQCFPIPPDGGTMKIRIGITAPLQVERLDTGRLALPRIVERNFRIPEGFEHSLFAESAGILKLLGSSPNSGRVTKINIPEKHLAAQTVALACHRDSSVTSAWTPDTLAPEEFAIVQTLERLPAAQPDELAIVIDGSRSLAGARKQIASALAGLPAGCRCSVIVAGDDVRVLMPPAPASQDTVRNAADAVLQVKFVGGADNRPALIDAWNLVSHSGRGTVVWIHGPQPFTSGSGTDQLAQLAERRRGTVRLVAVAAADGRNRVLADLERIGVAESVPRLGSLKDDLARVFAGWSDRPPDVYCGRRVRVPRSEAKGVRCSSHLARLWARDEVMRMCAMRDGSKGREASTLAVRYQLVTPVSGAVVLENDEQYRQAGLKPVDPGTVPEIVPEPSSLLALGIGAAATLSRLRRKQHPAVRRPGG